MKYFGIKKKNFFVFFKAPIQCLKSTEDKRLTLKSEERKEESREDCSKDLTFENNVKHRSA